MKFKNTFYSMRRTVLLSYHLVHSYHVLNKPILLLISRISAVIYYFIKLVFAHFYTAMGAPSAKEGTPRI